MGMELAQEEDFSVALTLAGFMENAKLFPAPPGLWAGRKEPLSMECIDLRQCKLGESRRAATVPRPGICAGLPRIASRINALCGSDVYRINELVRAAKDWQRATVLKYASSANSWKTLGRGDRVKGALRKRGDRAHGKSMTMVGWSYAP